MDVEARIGKAGMGGQRGAVNETKTREYRFDGPEDASVLILGPSLGTTWHMWDRQVPKRQHLFASLGGLGGDAGSDRGQLGARLFVASLQIAGASHR